MSRDELLYKIWLSHLNSTDVPFNMNFLNSTTISPVNSTMSPDPPKRDLCSYDSINGTFEDLVYDPNCYRYSWLWNVSVGIANWLIFLFGLMGNALAISVVAFIPRMRTVTNLFILNLAVADLFVILFCVPATYLSNLFVPWILGRVLCKALPYIQGVSIFSSVYSLVAVSLDRCRAIYRPMELSSGLSKRQAFISVGFIWLTSLIITVPWFITFDIRFYPGHGELPFCIQEWTTPVLGQIYFLLVHVLICYFVPLVLILIFNCIIWRSVSVRHVPCSPSPVSETSNAGDHIHAMHRATKLRVLRMLTALTLAFFLCWLPLYCVTTRWNLFGYPPKDTWEDVAFHMTVPLGQLLGSTNSCINPLLYAFLNKKFRHSALYILSRCFPRCIAPPEPIATGLASPVVMTSRLNSGLNSDIMSRRRRPAFRRRRDDVGERAGGSALDVPIEMSRLSLSSRVPSNASVATTQITISGQNGEDAIACTRV